MKTKQPNEEMNKRVEYFIREAYVRLRRGVTLADWRSGGKQLRSDDSATIVMYAQMLQTEHYQFNPTKQERK